MLNRPVENFTAIMPRGNMVLVEPIKGVQRSEGGIELPDSYSEGPDRVRIVAVGTGNRKRDGDGFMGIGLKPGDIVGHSAKVMVNVSFGSRQLLLVNADSIVCVFDEAQIANSIKIVK